MPGFIEKEFRSFLDCGVLAPGLFLCFSTYAWVLYDRLQYARTIIEVTGPTKVFHVVR